jgi:hypothetical protein|tara:strand:+ start:127 stop:297 length:171 start_codon:yes stop_codon:yes gene_type:complete
MPNICGSKYSEELIGCVGGGGGTGECGLDAASSAASEYWTMRPGFLPRMFSIAHIA